MNEYPLCTIIAVCYNHERFVVECLESIRNQTYPNIQLVIIDDCSSDHSVECIQKWIQEFKIECTFIAHSENRGLPKTLNEALTHVQGEYVSVLATDDIWLPDFINTYISVFSRQPNKVGVVYGNSYMIDENSDLLPGLRKTRDSFPEGDVYAELLKGVFLCANAFIVKRGCYDLIGPYDEELFFEDFDLWLRLASHFEFVYCSIILAKYRVVSTAMTKIRMDEIDESAIRIYQKHLIRHLEYANLLEERMTKEASRLYKLKHPLRFKYLGKAAYRSKTNFLRYLAALLGISYVTYQKLEFSIHHFFIAFKQKM